MIRNRLHGGWPSAAILVLLLVTARAASATPATFSQDLHFATGSPSPSLWAPGASSSSFGADGSAGIPQVTGPFDVQITPGLGVAYDFSASSGSVAANVSGTLQASYDDRLSAPGTGSIAIGFAPTAGRFSTALGVSADLTGYVDRIPFGSRWDFCFYCQDWSLDTGSSATPGFGVTRSGSDSVSVAGVGPSFGSIASAQANINATQTSRFRLDELNGLLAYENQTTGTSGVVALALAAGTSFLDVDLSEPGIWDFGFVGLALDNTFSSTMGASLSFDIDVFSVIEESWTFAGLDLLDTGGFALDLGERSIATAFSITVVPEPGTVFLLGSGLLGFALRGRAAERRPDRKRIARPPEPSDDVRLAASRGSAHGTMSRYASADQRAIRRKTHDERRPVRSRDRRDLARTTVRRVGRHAGHAAPVDPDRREGAHGMLAVGQPRLARAPVRHAARADDVDGAPRHTGLLARLRLL
jgi:hypothetical protein